MLKDNTESNWTGRIAASLAIVVALSGGLWLSDKASGGTEPATAIATSCSGFKADAGKLFDKGDGTALRGTFAAGDHVHLVINFNGAGYSWELTGALGKKPDVTSTGPFTYTYTHTKSTVTESESTPPTRTTSTVSRGRISGFARLDLELDVANAGDGAITINRTGNVPSFARVAIATCKAATRPTA